MATRTIPDRKTAPRRAPSGSPAATEPAAARTATAKPATAKRSTSRSVHAASAAAVQANTRAALDRLVRPVTASFLVVPLVAAVAGAGDPARLLTLSGAAALLLAADLVLERMGRPTPPTRSLAIGLIGWVAGLLLLGAAGEIEFGPYHGEAAAVVGVITAAFVGATCPRPTAVLRSLSGAGAVGLGASMVGPPNPGMAMAVSSVAFGAVAGVILRASLDGPPQVSVSGQTGGYDEVVAAALVSAKTDLDAAVTAGTITQDKADAIYSRLETWLNDGGPGNFGDHPFFRGPGAPSPSDSPASDSSTNSSTEGTSA